MPDGNDGDRLPSLVHLIDHDVAPDHESAQIWIDIVREAPAQERLFGQSLGAIEKILDDTLCGGGIFLGNEVEELRGPIQSGIGPEDAIGHLLVASQKAGPGLVVGNDSAGLDIGQAPMDIPEKIQFLKQGLIRIDIDENRRPPPFLRQHDRTPRILHLSEQTLRLGLEVRGWLNVFGQVERAFCHELTSSKVPSYRNFRRIYPRRTVPSISP